MATVVIFRRWDRRDGPVIALFPEEPVSYVNQDLCSSYEHVGQHGAANYHGVINNTVPTSLADADVQELKRELEGIGYVLDVRQRETQAMRRKRMLTTI